ncbi:hypothetical protein LCGC14_1352230 [marine sediment metagenome]|uniref:Uncharacterized protein n=1 Tax=marine sediment metagenome TaxID=412755 RepID=A0A0F9MR52_9ZZZZ
MIHIYFVRRDGALGISIKRFEISGDTPEDIRAKWEALNTPRKWEILRVESRGSSK